MAKKITITLGLLVLLAVGWVIYLYWMAGQFKTIEPHYAGKCKAVGGVVGPEDITIHPRTGIAYVSGCDRRAVQEGRPGRGAIYAYDLNAVTAEPVNLTPDADPDFRPHGIGLYVGRTGEEVLFVINHKGGEHSVEVFDLKEGALVYKETLTSPMLVSPNDIVPVGFNSFYVTNDHRYPSGWKRMMEDYLRLRRSNVLFYDGSGFVEAASGIGYANGINVSPDGRLLYVCSITGGSLHIFARDPATGGIEFREEVDLGTGVDNIEVDSEGGLWIGAHPQLLTTAKHSKDPLTVSPSQVIHLTPQKGGGYDVEEVYLDKGEELSASTVAAVRGNRLLIGAIFDSKFLDCRR